MQKGAFLKLATPIIFLLFILVGSLPSLYASGLLMYEQGDPAIGTAAVGQTVADDSSSAYYNPAGMVGLERSEVMMGNQLLIMHAKFKTDPDVQNPYVGSDGGNMGMLIPGGGLYYVQKLYKDRVAAGLALNAPMGLGLDAENGWKGRYIVQDTMLAVMNINPSLSVKITDWLQVGGGLSVYYCSMNTDMAVFNPPAVALLPLQVSPNADGKANLKMDDWAVGYNLGFMLKPRKGTRIGFSYRSEANFNLKGKMKLEDLGDVLTNQIESESGIKSRLTLPRSIMVSAYQDINDRLALLFDVGWQDWSSMKSLSITGPLSTVDINQDWTDTYRLGIGTHYRLLKKLKLKAGFSFDSDPTKLANRTPMMPMAKTWRWGTGFDYDLNPNMVVSLNWEFVGMGSGRIDKEIQPIVVDPQKVNIGPRTIFPGRQFTGNYNQYINMIGVTFRWKFGKGESDSKKEETVPGEAPPMAFGS